MASHSEGKRQGKSNKWGYSESFFFAFGLIFVGVLIEYFTTGKTVIPGWPINLFIILGYIFVTAIIYYVINGKTVKWLVSIPSAIAAVSAMTFMVLLMGFIPQDDIAGQFSTKIGLTHVTRSSPYLLAALYLLTVLTLAIYKRLKKPVTLKKVAYLLNHGGLWIVIVSASLGTADLKRLNMSLEEGNTKSIAVDASKTAYKVPFEITLHDFIMDEYPPKIAIYNNLTGKLLKVKTDKNPVSVEKGLETNIGMWNIEILEFYPDAKKTDQGYTLTNERGATPVALIKARNENKNILRKDWVTCGSPWMNSKRLPLSRSFTLVMLSPSPKRYASEITILEPDGTEKSFTLEVNKPYSFGDWKVYQSGYDSRLGEYSKLSILELVYDPWLKVIYTGVFMLFLGSLYLMFFGKKKNKKL